MPNQYSARKPVYNDELGGIEVKTGGKYAAKHLIKVGKKTEKTEKPRLPRNPLVPQLNKHKNQLFKDKKKEKSKNICRERVKDST